MATTELTFTLTATQPDPADDPQEGHTYPTNSFTRWYVCATCGHQAPATKMGLIDGVPYCYRFRDYEEKIHEMKRQRENK